MQEEEPVPEDIRNRYLAFGFANLELDNKSAENWYCLLGSVQGAKCLPHILEGSLQHQIDYTDFERDTLFREWTYIIDWEQRELFIRGGDGDIDEKCSFDNPSVHWMQDLYKGW